MRERQKLRDAARFGVLSALAMVGVVLLGGAIAAVLSRSTSTSPSALASNPELDSGTPLSGGAPGFTLPDQFGRAVSLRSYRGKVVILAFNDSQCTTICPLTTTAMVDAKAMLGAAGSRVELLGIDANPSATAVNDVRSYSGLHGMMHQWHFLTGSLAQLKRVWKAYNIEVAIEQGQIDHTPALYVIAPNGRLARLYLTQQSYAAVGQLGQLLAHEASSLLPGHPAPQSNLSYVHIQGESPETTISLTRAGGGSVRLGPGNGPRLQIFFATWDQEVMDLRSHLDALNGYAARAAAHGLPALTAIDEGSVEPSRAALPEFLHSLRRPLAYPVAIDRSGQVADGYEVQDEPWIVLTSSSGRILWYYDVSVSGRPSETALAAQVRSALARAPRGPSKLAVAQQQLAGSAPPLASLHQQASQLLGSEPQLAARIRALHGYPVVINTWASWCTPCRSEFGLLASASAHYGHRVAFVGADTDDSPGDARSFLAQHPVSYPSYQATTTNITSIIPAGLRGLPTTIFLDRNGKVVYVHTGQYDAQGTLDDEIGKYALGG